jgi:hypothetical protein
MSNEPKPESQSDVERAEAIATEVADGCVYKRGTDNYARVWQGARLGALRVLPRDPQGLVEALRRIDQMSLSFDTVGFVARGALTTWEAGK